MPLPPERNLFAISDYTQPVNANEQSTIPVAWRNGRWAAMFQEGFCFAKVVRNMRNDA